MNDRQPRRRHRLFLVVSVLAMTILGLLLVARPGGPALAAADPKALSSQMSDAAFALLASLTKDHDTPSPLLGPVGVFAADSQKLSAALAGGHRRAAAVAMASLKADADAVDKAAAGAGPDAAKWKAIRADFDSLAGLVPAAPAGAAAAAFAEPEPAAAPVPAVAPESEGPSSPLAVNIDSSQMVGADVLRLKGSLRGRDIRSAGIYLGNSRLGKLALKPARGSREIDFSLEIHHPAPGAVLRIYDLSGRSAEAPIMNGPVVMRSSESAQPPAAAPSSAPSLDSDDDLASGGPDLASPAPDLNDELKPPEPDATGDNTKEIPAAVTPPSGPKRRMRSHLRARGASDVRIRIDDLSAVGAGMRQYRVRGQIVGSELLRAGIYVDGRLEREIPLNGGAGLVATNFAQTFDAAGSQAAIRVYRGRGDFTESSIDLGTADAGGADSNIALGSVLGGSIASNPAASNPYGTGLNPDRLAVQITSVQAAAPSLYLVSGMISGRNLASAGLYQNGVLVQNFSVSGSGGIGGLISGLMPSVSRQVPFTGRFNPAQGYATVRVFDRSGMMAEQPVMGGGTGYGVNPYANPYGSGAVNPYVSNPYGGASPYLGVGPGVGMAPGVGTTPYGTGPGVTGGPARTSPWSW
jgi:hypothetical protein